MLLHEALAQLRVECSEAHAVVPTDLLTTLRNAAHSAALLAGSAGPPPGPAPAVVRGGYWSAVVHGGAGGGGGGGRVAPPTTQHTLPLKRRLDNAMDAVAHGGTPWGLTDATAPGSAQPHQTVPELVADMTGPLQGGGLVPPAPKGAGVHVGMHVSSGHGQLMDSLAARLKRLRREDAAYEEWLLGEAIKGEDMVV